MRNNYKWSLWGKTSQPWSPSTASRLSFLSKVSRVTSRTIQLSYQKTPCLTPFTLRPCQRTTVQVPSTLIVTSSPLFLKVHLHIPRYWCGPLNGQTKDDCDSHLQSVRWTCTIPRPLRPSSDLSHLRNAPPSGRKNALQWHLSWLRNRDSSALYALQLHEQGTFLPTKNV